MAQILEKQGTAPAAEVGEVTLIEGGLHTDSRGSVAFFNGFRFTGVDRFYIIRPAEPRVVRGWTGHRREWKWFTAVDGTLVVAVVRPNDWHAPSPDLAVSKFVLSARKPQMLAVPPGHATGIVAFSPTCALMVFSTGKIDETPSDCYRFPAETWKIPDRLSTGGTDSAPSK